MQSNYRIREQYGLFFIEQECEWIDNKYKRGWFSNVLVSSESTKYWRTVEDYNLVSSIDRASPNKKFKTLAEAKTYIESLDPIYHEV